MSVGQVGKLLFSEIAAAGWGSPQLKLVQEVGAAFGTNTGDKRKRNEDRLAIARVQSINGETYTVAILCDGVGGTPNGDIAASSALAYFVAELVSTREVLPLPRFIDRTLRRVDDAIRNDLAGKGATTLSVVLASKKSGIVIANVGDSRIYSVDRATHRIQQLTEDDTMENALKKMGMDESALAAKGLRGTLSQAIGESGRTAIDLKITVTAISPAKNLGLVLASDGAWKGGEKAFKAIVANGIQAETTVRRVLSMAAWTGGLDNVSVIAVTDLAAFQTPGASASTFAQVSVWVCDTKVVLGGLEIDVDSSQKPDEMKEVAAPRPQPKRAPKKRLPRRKKEPMLPGFSEQLSLEDEPRSSDKLRGQRQEVEISVDSGDEQT